MGIHKLAVGKLIFFYQFTRNNTIWVNKRPKYPWIDGHKRARLRLARPACCNTCLIACCAMLWCDICNNIMTSLWSGKTFWLLAGIFKGNIPLWRNLQNGPKLQQSNVQNWWLELMAWQPRTTKKTLYQRWPQTDVENLNYILIYVSLRQRISFRHPSLHL